MKLIGVAVSQFANAIASSTGNNNVLTIFAPRQKPLGLKAWTVNLLHFQTLTTRIMTTTMSPNQQQRNEQEWKKLLRLTTTEEKSWT